MRSRRRERGLTLLEVTVSFVLLSVLVSGSIATCGGLFRDASRSSQHRLDLQRLAGHLEELRASPPDAPGRRRLPSGELLVVTEREPGLWQLEVRRGTLALTTLLAREGTP